MVGISRLRTVLGIKIGGTIHCSPEVEGSQSVGDSQAPPQLITRHTGGAKKLGAINKQFLCQRLLPQNVLHIDLE